MNNQEYVLTYIDHEANQAYSLPGSTALEGESEFSYRNQFACIPFDVPFRPPQRAEKKFVRGLQTAIVVGPEGEEIHTDQYGRVKVQFHWDREGKKDDKSSCWIRVGGFWAGKGWGAVFTPRVGDEVIVDFLEGDPDKPLIVGSVYNQDNPPLYSLPDEKTKSTIKTKSTPNDPGYNEIRFEDKKDREEIYIHAQKDMNERVLNNHSTTIGANRTQSVGANKTIRVGLNHTETIGQNMTLTIGQNKTETVSINTAETIGAAKELTIGGLYQVSVGGVYNQMVAGAKTVEIGGAHVLAVGGVKTERIGRKSQFRAQEIEIEADQKITLRCGAASIELQSNGNIEVNGANITVTGTGRTEIETAQVLRLQGAQTRINC